MKVVKCLPLRICTVFLKNRNFISKIKISKVTDYADIMVDGKNESENRLEFDLKLRM